MDICKKVLACVVAIGGLAMTNAAHASPTTYISTFSQSNLLPSSTTQDWGTLTVYCQANNNCAVSLTPNGDTFFGNEFLSFNLASGTSNLVLSSAMISAGASLSAGSFNVNGFGTFGYQIGLPDGPASGFSSAVSLFTVDYHGTAGTLLTLNSDGFDAAGHVLPANSTCTGFVAEGTGTEEGSSNNCGSPTTGGVPEPRGLALLAIGFLGLGLIGGRRGMKNSAY